MKRSPSSPRIQSGTISCSSSAVARPGIFCCTNTNGPLSVSRTSRSATLTPLEAANPSAALVGLPALKAALAGGPLASSSRSGCRSGRPLISTAKRRGVPYTCKPSFSKNCSASAAGILICHWASASPTKLAGSSSVPTSSKKVAIGISEG